MTRVVTCERCGLSAAIPAGSRARGERPFRYDPAFDQIICARGKGCSRMAEKDRRIVRMASDDAENESDTRQYRYGECWLTLREIHAMCHEGVTLRALRKRLDLRWSIEDAIERPARTRQDHVTRKAREHAIQRQLERFR